MCQILISAPLNQSSDAIIDGELTSTINFLYLRLDHDITQNRVIHDEASNSCVSYIPREHATC